MKLDCVVNQLKYNLTVSSFGNLKEVFPEEKLSKSCFGIDRLKDDFGKTVAFVKFADVGVVVAAAVHVSIEHKGDRCKLALFCVGDQTDLNACLVIY